MPDPIAPPVASRPAEAVELVSLAVSDGDLEAALAQYEAGAVLRPWARDPGGNTDGVADSLIQLMGLRLPLSVRIRTIVPGGGLALIIGERHIVGTSPDCERVQLSGAGATVVRRQPGGSWRIAVDAWYLDGPSAGQARGLYPARTGTGGLHPRPQALPLVHPPEPPANPPSAVGSLSSGGNFQRPPPISPARQKAFASRKGQAMPFTLTRSVAGFALLGALAAGCGTAAAAHHAAPKPKPAATAHHHHHSRPMHAAVTTPPAPPATAPAQTANPIPQGNGGDQDADNNGGPTDGDGNI